MFAVKTFISYVGVMHVNMLASLVCRTCTSLIIRYLFKGLGVIDSSKYCSIGFQNVFMLFSSLLPDVYAIYLIAGSLHSSVVSCSSSLPISL